MHDIEIVYFRGIIFGAAAGGLGGNYYFVGGRSYNHESQEWDYLSSAWNYNSMSNSWQALQSLNNATGIERIHIESISILRSGL